MIAIPAGFTPTDYLTLEAQSLHRHEYRAGQVYAMAGGSDDHDELCLNLIEILRSALRGSDCAVRSGNVKVSYQEQFYYYPDAFVTCDPRDRTDRQIKRYPKLIAEVLSPSTQEFDQTTKFEDYAQIATLEDYLLLHQTQLRVEVRRRGGGGSWQVVVYGPGSVIKLPSVGVEVAIEVLYQGVSGTEDGGAC
ncbi:MAG: Uma2 family endonuclease [Prochlorothrix sp.]